LQSHTLKRWVQSARRFAEPEAEPLVGAG
jgi:hypothetical protein